MLYQKLLPLLTEKEQAIFHENLEINQKGIIFNQKQLNWLEIDAVETYRGNLTFKTKNKTDIAIKLPLNQIKNLDLLLFIIHNPGLRENFAS